MREGLVHLAAAADVAPNGHPGTEARVWAARITECWRSSVEGIIRTGRLLIEAKAELPHGAWGDMLEGLPFGERTAQRLMAIGQDNRLSNPTHVSLLPASWGTLYELTKLSDDEFTEAVQQHVIRPDMLRGEAELIRPLAQRQPVLESSSAVERFAVNEDVAGSKPASPATDEGARCSGSTSVSKTEGDGSIPSAPAMPSGGLAIAHRRVEDADSLDFFPTPPWATRALFEHVLAHLGRRGHCQFQTAWEPACGKGHMAEPMKEYFRRVYATDIHAYGYSDDLVNFLEWPPARNSFDGSLHPPHSSHTYDWIITNPPFNTSADFVLRALKLAGTGVAMFVRLAWLESGDRYERIFRDHPPTCVSIFAERVPLHKGRWESEGSTMTAYIWLVWLKGAAPQAPFWIPPGCRERLTKPDDVKRFGKSVEAA